MGTGTQPETVGTAPENGVDTTADEEGWRLTPAQQEWAHANFERLFAQRGALSADGRQPRRVLVNPHLVPDGVLSETPPYSTILGLPIVASDAVTEPTVE